MKMLSLLLIAIGVVFLVVGTVYPLVTVVVDTTPPAVRLVYPSTATGTSLTELVAYVKDPESGIQSVTCVIQNLVPAYALSYVSNDPIFNDEKWYKDIPDITTAGTYSYSWAITNKAGLVTTLTGTYTIYTALQGKWYVNDIEITSSTQTVYTTSATVNFKFAKTAGVADSSITCTVWEGTAQLLTLTPLAGSMWSGSYTFANGQHTLNLKASDGTQTITMSVIGLQVGSGGFEMSMQMILWIVGAVFIVAGVGVEIIKPKGLPLEGKL
jgi:hypothetical protein